MKFYNLLLAAGLLLFAGCDFGGGGDDTDDPALEGEELSDTEKDRQDEDVEKSQADAEAKYNPAFQLKVTAGEGEAAEELLVVHQSSKDGSQHVVLVVDDKKEMKATSSGTSADFSQTRINARLENKLKIEKNICTGEISADLLNIYGSLAVVSGGAVNVLTGSDAASGYTVAGGLENEAAAAGSASIQLSKGGAAAVAFTEVAGSRAASSLALGEYADWFMTVTATGFCAQFVQENPPAAPEAPEGAAPAVEAPPAEGAAPAEGGAEAPPAEGGATA